MRPLFFVFALSLQFLFLQGFAQSSPTPKKDQDEIKVPPARSPKPVDRVVASDAGIAFGPGLSWAGGDQPLYYFMGRTGYDHAVRDLERTSALSLGLQVWGHFRLYKWIGLKTSLGFQNFREEVRYDFTSTYTGSGAGADLDNGRAEMIHGSTRLLLRVAPSFNFGSGFQVFVNPGIEAARLLGESWNGEIIWTESSGGSNTQYLQEYTSVGGTTPWEFAGSVEAGIRFHPGDSPGFFLLMAEYRHGFVRSIDQSLYSRSVSFRVGYGISLRGRVR